MHKLTQKTWNYIIANIITLVAMGVIIPLAMFTDVLSAFNTSHAILLPLTVIWLAFAIKETRARIRRRKDAAALNAESMLLFETVRDIIRHAPLSRSGQQQAVHHTAETLTQRQSADEEQPFDPEAYAHHLIESMGYRQTVLLRLINQSLITLVLLLLWQVARWLTLPEYVNFYDVTLPQVGMILFLLIGYVGIPLYHWLFAKGQIFLAAILPLLGCTAYGGVIYGLSYLIQDTSPVRWMDGHPIVLIESNPQLAIFVVVFLVALGFRWILRAVSKSRAEKS